MTTHLHPHWLLTRDTHEHRPQRRAWKRILRLLAAIENSLTPASAKTEPIDIDEVIAENRLQRERCRQARETLAAVYEGKRL